MPINDPKTPFHEEEDEDQEMNQNANGDEDDIDPETAAHLAEARANQQANAIVTSGVRRSQQPGSG